MFKIRILVIIYLFIYVFIYFYFHLLEYSSNCYCTHYINYKIRFRDNQLKYVHLTIFLRLTISVPNFNLTELL